MSSIILSSLFYPNAIQFALLAATLRFRFNHFLGQEEGREGGQEDASISARRIDGREGGWHHDLARPIIGILKMVWCES